MVFHINRLRNYLILSSRRLKQVIAGAADFSIITFVIIFLLFINEFKIEDFDPVIFIRLLIIPAFSIYIFYKFGIYKSIHRYIDITVIYLFVKAILLALLLNLIVGFIFNQIFKTPGLGLIVLNDSSSFLNYFTGVLSVIILIVGSRLFAVHFFNTKKNKKRVVIYGAGSAGLQLAEALKVSLEMRPIAFIDSDPALIGTYLGGIKVMDPGSLERLSQRQKVDEVLIAMPSISKSILNRLLREIELLSIKVRILPGLAELALGKVLVSELKEVDISDLLGRYEVEPNRKLLNKNIKDKVVMVTGAGGSIGSEISRQIIKYNPKKLIILDVNEFALYEIKQEIEKLLHKDKVFSVLANVTNQSRMTEICNAFMIDTIYHTAAYKHVPIVEENPFEAIENNIIGTQSCALAAIEAEVETFVLISTDKAVRPTNIMGATKRFSELILQSLSNKVDMECNTRMTMVRFGNVLGSSGSAIPLFQKQIKEGGPVTVTHPEIIRYFMSIQEASELVIQAGAMGKGGDVFVLDMGEPVQIVELAKRLIKLSGFQLKDEYNPTGDIEIIFTGLRPGEKLYEELLIGDNVGKTEHKQILRAEEDYLSYVELKTALKLLKEAELKGDILSMKNILQETVVGFTPEKDIVDVLYLQKNH